MAAFQGITEYTFPKGSNPTATLTWRDLGEQLPPKEGSVSPIPQELFCKEDSEMIDANYNSLRDQVARSEGIDSTSVHTMQVYGALCQQLNADLKRLGGLDVQVDGECKHFQYAEDLFTFFRGELGLSPKRVYQILAQLQQSVFAEFQITCVEKTGLIPVDLTLTKEGAKIGGWKICCIVNDREIRIDHEKNFSLQDGADLISTVSAHAGFVFPRNEEPAEAFFSWKILEV
jgi:hypothetical protein